MGTSAKGIHLPTNARYFQGDPFALFAAMSCPAYKCFNHEACKIVVLPDTWVLHQSEEGVIYVVDDRGRARAFVGLSSMDGTSESMDILRYWQYGPGQGELSPHGRSVWRAAAWACGGGDVVHPLLIVQFASFYFVELSFRQVADLSDATHATETLEMEVAVGTAGGGRVLQHVIRVDDNGSRAQRIVHMQRGYALRQYLLDVLYPPGGIPVVTAHWDN